MKYLVLIPVSLLVPGIAFAGQSPLAYAGLKTFLVLMVIVAMLFALGWSLRRYGPVARAKKTLGLEVIGQVPLNQKAGLALVKTGKTLLLVGVTYYSVTLVKDLGEDSFDRLTDKYSHGDDYAT
ncbi:MAG: hypothetical protein DRG37_05510 [Deltaproteobacteria bacterium]|nr:MAG: hypothetical protein DRG37_05510 [Deltaproteobacteria bacterium]